MVRRTLFVVLALASCAFSASARAEEAAWPQFRGPTGQGHADARHLPTTWDDQQNVAWNVLIRGRGWSSPVIVDDQVWLTTATDQGHSLRAICVHRDRGKIVHDVEVFHRSDLPAINAKNTYASPTPIADGPLLYVHFGTLGTACIERATGRVVWRNDELQLDHKEGPGSSPVVHGHHLIIPCDGMDVQYLAALDKETGELAWRSDRPEPHDPNPDFRKAYCTPLVIDVDNRALVVSPAASRVLAYEPATGEAVWQVDYEGFSNVPRPVFGDGLVFVATGYMKPSLLAIRPDGRGNVTDSHVVWRYARGVPNSPSPLWIDHRLYMVSDKGVGTCLDARTGEPVWTERLGGNFSASGVYADGHIYWPSEEGFTYVIRPGETYDLIAKNALPEAILASPAVAGRALYIRTEMRLYRVEDTRRTNAGTSPAF